MNASFANGRRKAQSKKRENEARGREKSMNRQTGKKNEARRTDKPSIYCGSTNRQEKNSAAASGKARRTGKVPEQANGKNDSRKRQSAARRASRQRTVGMQTDRKKSAARRTGKVPEQANGKNGSRRRQCDDWRRTVGGFPLTLVRFRTIIVRMRLSFKKKKTESPNLQLDSVHEPTR